MNQRVRFGSVGVSRSLLQLGGVAMFGLMAFACGSDAASPTGQGGASGQGGSAEGGKAGHGGSGAGVGGQATGDAGSSNMGGAGSGPVGGSAGSPQGGAAQGGSAGSAQAGAPAGGSAGTPQGGAAAGGSAGSTQGGGGGQAGTSVGGSAGTAQAGAAQGGSAGNPQGGAAQGGSAGSPQGGAAQGGSAGAQGGAAQGGGAGSAQGGAAQGGSAQGGAAQGGSAGSAQGGSAGSAQGGSGGGGGTSSFLSWQNGYISGPSNIGNVHGYWYTFHDTGTSTILPSSFATAGANICVTGNAAQYSNGGLNWGSAVGFNANQAAGTNPPLGAWNATAAGIAGFRFTLTGSQVPSSIQVNVTVAGSTASYCSKLSGVTAGTSQAVIFGSVTQNCFNSGGSHPIVDPTKIEAIQLQVSSVSGSVTAFDFCVSSVQLLPS